MSDIGLAGAQFEINQESLRAFDNAMGRIHSCNISNKQFVINALLSIMEPIAETIQYRVNTITLIDEYSIIEFLKKKAMSRDGSDWNKYIRSLQSIIARIKQNDIDFNPNEIEILNDIGDALNEECNRHYRKLRG